MDTAVTKIVTRGTKFGLMKAAGIYDADALLDGHTLHKLTRGVRHHLQATFSDLGIYVQEADSVLLDALNPPKILAETSQTVYRYRKMGEVLEQYAEATPHLLLIDSLTQGHNMVYMASPVIDQTPLNIINGNGSLSTVPIINGRSTNGGL